MGITLSSEQFAKVNERIKEEGLSFPGGYIPSVKELVSYMESEKFYLTDVESLRRHYGRTLEHWATNFENALPEIGKTKDKTPPKSSFT